MRKSPLGWILLSGASLAALSGAAYAQDEGAVSDEIVVTATGREAAIQDVPVAVTAVDGDTLQNSGVENLLDLQQLAPSLRIGAGQSTSAGTIARIRGFGTGGDNPAFESAVGFFIDGVYRARAGIAVSDLPELDRIEVLRGPQGTLFGRNTAAGAIAVYTTRPSFDTGMWIEGGAGDLDYGAARAGINVPLIEDVLAIRIDGSVRTRDGFMVDQLTGEDYNTQRRWSLRGQALWDITPDLSFRLIADVASTDEDCCAATMLRYGDTQIILNDSYLAFAGAYAPFLPTFGFGANANLPSTLIVPPPTPASPFERYVDDPEGRLVSVTPFRDYLEQVDDAGISGEFNWAIGDMNFTSITSYRDWNARRGQDIDFNVVDLFYRDGLTIAINTFTQEFRLQGEAGRLNWLVGAFYSHEELDTTDTIRYGDRASDYANALVFLQTSGTREFFDLTDAPTDAFLGGDPVPSILGLLNAAFDQTYLARNTTGSGQQADQWLQEANSFSIFTHNEIELADNLILTAGLRWNRDEKEITGILDAANPACTSMQGLEAGFGLFSGLNAAANGPPGPAQAQAAGLRTLLAVICAPQGNDAADSTAANPWTGSSEEDAFTGTLSLAYHVNDDLMFYGGYSRGYKAGGFNVDRSGFEGIFPGMTVAQAQASLSTDQLAYDPETTDSFELGMRSTIFGGSTFFNVTLFHQTLTDYQLNAFNGTAFITRNVPEAISRGVEMDFLMRPTEWLTLQGGVNYTDAYNNSTIVFVPNSPLDTIFEGDPLVQVPEWSLTGAATIVLPVSEHLQALFYVDARYDTEHRTQALGRSDPISDMDSSLSMNARIGIGDPDRSWSLEVWGRNITDEFIYGGFNNPLQSGTVGAFTNEPRTWGVTLRARY